MTLKRLALILLQLEQTTKIRSTKGFVSSNFIVRKQKELKSPELLILEDLKVKEETSIPHNLSRNC